MVFQVNGNRHRKRAGVAGVTLRAVGAGRLHQPLWGRMKGSESVQGATTPPMPQRAAQALWCKPIKARHVASWTAISAGSGRHVYMQQITPEEVLCVLVTKEALLGEKKPALGGLNAHCVRKPESCLSQIITAGQHCIR
jgi:hypothetical protein